jgi:hypothetical protein
LGAFQTLDSKEKRKLSDEKEKVSGLASMKSLANNIKRLIATKQSMCGDARENSIQSVGAFVLESQIKAFMATSLEA